MAHLAILQPDARAEARLGDALGGIHRVSFVRSWADLRRLLAREALDGCVVDADFPNREDAVTEMRRLRKLHGDLALVAYADVHENDFELYRFGGLGVNGVVLARRPPWASGIRNAIERALASSRADRVRSALEGRYDPAATAAVAWAVEHAQTAQRVDDFAGALGVSTRELADLLRANALPSPGRLLMWGRLLRAGAYLGKDGRTVEDTALRLGYSTASALGRAMKRETGETPGDVARRGGLPFVHARLFHGRPPRRRSNGTRAWTVALLAFWQAGCATLGLGGGGVDRHRIDAVLVAPPMDQVHFGVLAVDAASGKTLYARNAQRKFVPASNQKILVTAAALSLLGPDYRYETALWSNGPLDGGTLRGDLVLVGTGAPTLAPPFWPSGEAALIALADSLWAAGVRRVARSLVVDGTQWDSTSVGPTWEVEDQRFTYGSTGGAFALDRGEVTVVVRRQATAVLGRVLAQRGIEVGDGSGLSAYNLVTPRALVRVLRYMAAGPDALGYRHAMAEPGEEDSTLERRLPELQGRVFAKTGTLSNVNSLSGYLVGEDGREVVFSLLSNGSGLPSSRVRAALDDVLKVLAGIDP